MAYREHSPPAGRRATKFTPANLQKIKELVAQGISREQIAQLLDVSVGSLQVTCSRLGISLRTPNVPNGIGAPRAAVKSRGFVSTAPTYVGHMRREPDNQAKFELVLRTEVRQVTVEIPINADELSHVALEASVQGVGMLELMSQVVARAITKGEIGQILDDMPQSRHFERLQEARSSNPATSPNCNSSNAE
jgi:hypothetical protein